MAVNVAHLGAKNQVARPGDSSNLRILVIIRLSVMHPYTPSTLITRIITPLVLHVVFS